MSTELNILIQSGDVERTRQKLQEIFRGNRKLSYSKLDTALLYAAMQSLGMVKLLLSHGADVKTDGGSCMSWAIELQHVDTVEYLLRTYGLSDLQGKREDRSRFILESVACGNVEIFRLIINHGADVHINEDGPMRGCRFYHAGGGDRIEMIKLLLTNY